MQEVKRSTCKRKLRIDRVLILLLVILIPVGVILGIVKFLTSSSPYAKYEEYNEETKLAGSMEHDTNEVEDQYYLSVYYPEFNIPVLDKKIKDFKEKELLTNIKHEGMHFICVDYDSEQLFDRFTTVTFHQIVKDKDDKVVAKKDTSFNYDKKTDKILGVKDVLRRDYLNLLNDKAKTAKLDVKSLKSEQLSNFILGKNAVTFYLNDNLDQKMSVNYKDNSAYMKLADKNIPSLYQGNVETPKAQPKVDPNKPMVAITFDDGPHYENTEEIMKTFEKYNGRATFFMLGKNVEINADIVKDVYKRGFEIGNHSWDHEDLRTLDKKGVVSEIYDTQDAIYKLTGYEPTYFRPPYGALNETVLNANQTGYAFWDVDSQDWMLKEAGAIKTSVVKSTKAGNMVVLLHDIHDFSKDSIEPILAALSKDGYQFVTYSTLMQHEKDYLLQLDENYGVPKDIANGK